MRPLVEEGGLVEPGIPGRRHRGRSRSWGSGGGRSGSIRRRASRAPPWGRSGSDIGGPNEYDEVCNMGTWGVSGRIWQMRVGICNSWCIGCSDWPGRPSRPFGAPRRGRCLRGVCPVVGVNGDNHRSRFLGKSRISVLVKVPGRDDSGLFRVLDGPLEEGIQLVVVLWEDGTRD